jgi:hypothetical protein
VYSAKEYVIGLRFRFGALIWILYIPASRGSVRGAAAIWCTDREKGDWWSEWRMRCCKSVHTGAGNVITGIFAGGRQITHACIEPLSFGAEANSLEWLFY